MSKVALAIHGGCGVMPVEGMSEDDWRAARAALVEALRAGWRILRGDGGALDAVQAAVEVMENAAWFNAGYGAALNTAGEHELDAAIMRGGDQAAGAVCAARHIRNPILAARRLLDAGDAVLLTGAGADQFARDQGLAIVENTFFTTARQRGNLQRMKAHQQAGTFRAAREADKHGTVGAVALDCRGDLAAATSTGGYTNKPVGRVGDSPLIGAGTWAKNGVCAISATGQGEYFIRYAVAHDISARMALLGETLDAAAGRIIHGDLREQNVGAGLVAIDADGVIAAPYNTSGMYRGWITADGRGTVASHSDLFTFEPGA
ncbi:isoaspartyl peptidase/L-asparaginase family protein [Martelella alba]|uniref:Isoaspartyl peptidase/L-asparaginase n=1 Tax=Martelella alba TaxID=2590451 RepID=A0ABY2SGN8_9HYPH|nr:isoaspartyl peptidase/L-asparaginase [Martelella alba]TKI04326.1 isoaspartyl peptidase/L-asparaginase [Martelella alba]